MFETAANKSIVPSIIPRSYEDVAEHVRQVRDSAPRVQIDVLDGSYTEEVSWPYGAADSAFFDDARKRDQGLPFWQEVQYEVDLLLMEPEKRMESWVLAGASTLIVHVESTTKLDEILDHAYTSRVEIALALKPSTDHTLLSDYIDRVLFVQCMGNDRIGYQGVPLDPVVYDKLRAMRALWPNVPIGVDIGVHQDTIQSLVEAGATRFAVGSAVFEHPDPSISVQSLWTAVLNTHHDTS
jgi:ribulose-phosphate 3-epimerase